jgi:hypothetical protein
MNIKRLISEEVRDWNRHKSIIVKLQPQRLGSCNKGVKIYRTLFPLHQSIF